MTVPWHVDNKNSECPGGWAVVQDDTGDVAGCHQSQADAQQQVDALYAQEQQQGQPMPPHTGPHMAVDGGDAFAGMDEVPAYGVLVVEGVETGDSPRREFAPDSLTWADPPLPFKWQPAEGEGHSGSVVVGRMDHIWRDGNMIRWVGAMDNVGTAGREAIRLRQGNYLRGTSIMADDTDNEDVELIFPEGQAREGDGLDAMFAEPSKVVFHAARIRSATLLPEPAFVEATLELGADGEQPDDGEAGDGEFSQQFHLPGKHNQKDHGGLIHKGKKVRVRHLVSSLWELGTSPYQPPSMTAAAVGAHDTATSDAPWDGPAAEKALPSPMPVATARKFYAWIDDSQIEGGEIPKVGGRFGHHNVDGSSPGAANIKACQTGIGVLNGGRGGTTIPAADVQGVYNHLASHIRAAGLEPPELQASAEAVVTAAGYTVTIPEVWPEWWFDEPKESPPFGALHITPQGRVYGYLGPSKVPHRAFRASGRQVTIPRGIDYSEFQNKPCLVAGADGHVYRINAGNVTFDCGHPSPYDARRQDPSWAMQHYDNSCSVAARVRVGENAHGTWVAGGLLHGITPDAFERMMACALSGDWQGGKLNAALLVPVEGFPMAAASVRIRDDALVASTVPIVYDQPAPIEPVDTDAMFDLVAAAVGHDTDYLWNRALRLAGREVTEDVRMRENDTSTAAAG